MRIYYQKDEAVLEKYADDEAELYEQMQRMEHEQREQDRKEKQKL